VKSLSSDIKISLAEMKTMRLFEGVTKISPKDCVIDKDFDRVIFIVRKGTIGRAVGRNGSNIKKLKQKLGKDVDLVENDESPERFIKNSLMPAKIQDVSIVKKRDGDKLAFAEVNRKDKGLAIGKDGRNIHRARLLAKRYFDIENVILSDR
jgi:N utilization substance protein A